MESGAGSIKSSRGQSAIAIWTPGLNDSGNSLAGTVAAQNLFHFTGRSIFG
ncbi:hypothetical protein E4191_18740 (plasmid) [Paracoccus liaowanqingii]|uniref:glutaminase n=1 Tax=Paracoccus liaowanqingii TaxID=2560053 RepID=A0A4Y5SS71_9RHOB|nr:hypothetical protein E4191_18740 [Paracoccus liaowanqingii]